MNESEKLLIFRTCGMVLWVLQQLVWHSRIEEGKKREIIDKIKTLIKPLTAKVNQLQSNGHQGTNQRSQ